MEGKKRHISIRKGLIWGVVVSTLLFVSSLYIYNNYLVGRSFEDNIPLFIVGIVVGLVLIASTLLTFTLLGFLFGELLSSYYERKYYLECKNKIQVLPNNFVNVYIKNSNNFPLADFVASEDITCFAKLDENGKVVYKIQINAEYETDDYGIFLEHFNI